MLKRIINCENCALFKNQKPLIDNVGESDIMWVGLSAKMMESYPYCKPLDISTVTGALIAKIERSIPDKKFYKSNLVKCPPLNDTGKIRYPNIMEMKSCLANLMIEIDIIKPSIIVLLGSQVSKFIEKNYKIEFNKNNGYQYIEYKLNDISFIPIHHPSYISKYKSKDKSTYIRNICSLLSKNNTYVERVQIEFDF